MAIKRFMDRLNILFIDDKQSEIDMTKDLIESIGHNFSGAITKEDALSIIKNGDIDVAILDYQLGNGLNGVILAEEIYKTNPTIQLIIVTRVTNKFKEIIDLWVQRGVKILGFCPKKTMDIDLEGWLDVALKKKNNIDNTFKWGVL